MRFNPAPGWPPPPEGFVPGPGWRPDPRWPPAPPGWQLWVPADRGPDSQDYYPGVTLPPSYAPDGAEQAPPPYRPAPATTWGPQVAPPPSDTNGLAITAFVLGLLGIVGISAILGIVLGIVALRRIRRTLQRGKGLAIAGIVLGSCWLALAVVLVVTGVILGTTTPAQPSGSASTQGSGQRVDPFSLTTGDCFDNPAVTPGHVTTVGTVTQTSCTQPHNAQIFATFSVSGSILDYPGSAKLTSIASSGCNARAKTSLDSAKVTPPMEIRLLFPLESSWLAGHRTVSCIIFSPTATMKSSVLNG